MTYAWSGAGVFSNGTTATPTVTNATNSTYTVTVTAGCGAFTSSTVSVTLKPNPSVTTTDITPICGATSADLATAVSTTATIDGYFSNAALTAAITNVVTASGTYYVKVSNASNCTASASILVNAFSTNPSVTISVSPSNTFSAGTLVVFSATTNGTSYQWNVNGSAVSGANMVTYATDALLNNDQVSCTVTLNGCNTTSSTITVQTVGVVTSTGNIIVERLGSGGKVLTGNGNPIFLDQFTPSGSAATTIAIDSTGANALIESGTAASAGLLTRSANKTKLIIPGYSAALPNAVSVTGATATAINRAIAEVNAQGTTTIAARSASFYSANNFRGAVSDGTGNYWGAGTGTNSGINYFGTNGVAVNVSSTVTNTRAIHIFNGNLFFSTGAGTTGIYQVGTGLPTTTGTTSTLVLATTGGTGANSPYAFAFNATSDVCYVADDRTIANGGGIQKYTKTAGVWTRAYTLSTGTGSSVGARGLTVDFTNASTPILYITTADATNNRLMKITDNGSTSGNAATLISTATTNRMYRGVCFAPEISTPSIVINTTGFDGNFGTQNTGTTSSPARTFTVSGTNLTHNILLTPPTGFGTTIFAQDASGNAQNVAQNTTVTLILLTGTGAISGTVSGVILAGTNSVALSGILYNTAETGVSLTATASGGDALAAANSATFAVLPIATQLAFVNVPTSGYISTNINAFTVEARLPNNSVDVNYSGAITLTVASGAGNLTGALTANAIAGVASFNSLQFDAAGIYTLSADAMGLTQAVSSSITITAVPTLTEIILPQYAITGTVLSDRLQSLSRFRLDNLQPNTTYRYIVGASTSTTITTGTAPGNFFAINNTLGSAGTIVGYTSQKSFAGTLIGSNEFNITSGANRYAELTTDATGSYTGWFSFVSTGNAVFAAGNNVHVYVQLNNGANGTAIAQSLRTTNTIQMLGAATARSVRGSSNGFAENAVFLYNNEAGTGRPLYGTWLESNGINETDFNTWYASVNAIAGAWGAYVPTALANGIRRIESLAISDATLVGCPALSATGTWTNAGNTVNPTAGTASPIVFSVTDALLTPNYTLTASAGANGSISPSVTLTLNCGENQSYTITPNACYQILDVLVDGISVGAVGNYTFNDVRANHTIAATFALLPYTIIATDPEFVCGISSYNLQSAITATNVDSYAYFTDNTLTTAATNPVTASSIYYVVVTSTCGVTATAAVDVAFKPYPSVTITHTNTLTLSCDGTADLATMPTAALYSWSTTETTSVITATAGVYTVTITDTNGCTATASETVTSGCNEIYTPATTDVCDVAATVSTLVSGNAWVNIRNSNGRIVAAINPNGQNLGLCNVSLHLYTTVPNDANGYYLPRYFDFNVGTQPTTPVDVRLYFTNADLDAANAANPAPALTITQLALTHFGTGADCDVTNNTGGTTDIVDAADVLENTFGATAFYLEAAFSSFSEFGSLQTPAPLPVKLLGFSGVVSNKDNILNWITATEQNSSNFEIQAKTETNNWITVGEVGAAGNSTTNKYYTFMHTEQLQSNYYRLKMKDADGSFEYSNTIYLKRGKTGTTNLQAYPNPATDIVNIEFEIEQPQTMTYCLTNNLGQVIDTYSVAANAGNNQLKINLQYLPNGVYAISLTDANGVRNIKKVVKQ